jgi:hypothetical protein
MRLDTDVRLALLKHPLLADVPSLDVTRVLSRLLDESQQGPLRPLIEGEIHRLVGFGYLPWVVRLLDRKELPIAVASNVIRKYRPTKMDWDYHRSHLEKADAERAQLLAFARRPDLRAEDLDTLAARADDLDGKVVLGLLDHPACPPTAWTHIAKVRPDLALRHAALPHSLVVNLSGSRDPKLRAAAAAHPNLPSERWALLLRAGCSPDLSSVVERRVLTPEDAKALWDTGLAWDRLLVLPQPSFSDDWLMESFHERAAVRRSDEFLAAIENPLLSRFAFDLLSASASGWISEEDSYDESCGVEFDEQEAAQRSRVRARVRAHPAYRSRRSWTWALTHLTEDADPLGYLCWCSDDNVSEIELHRSLEEKIFTWRLYDDDRVLLETVTGTQKDASFALAENLGQRIKRKSLKASGLRLGVPTPVFVGRDSDIRAS